MTNRIIILLLLLLLFISILDLRKHNESNHYSSRSNIEIYDTIITYRKIPNFLYQKVSYENLQEALIYYDVQYPHILYAQAILETGHFSSYICKTYNNLFGLYDYKNKDYYKFDHWTDSIIGYLKYVQRKYNSEDDYYDFLSELPYATDSLYINKIKRLVNDYTKKQNSSISYIQMSK